MFKLLHSPLSSSEFSTTNGVSIRWPRNCSGLILILLVLHAGAAFSQQDPLQKPKPDAPSENVADTSRWWTLTDAVAPEELKAIHDNVELHRERRRQAARSGFRESLPEKDLARVEFFIDGSTHPELFPLWMAYSSFAGSFVFATFDPEQSLEEFGFDPEARETIVELTFAFENERSNLQTEIVEAMESVTKLARLGEKRLGPKSYQLAIEARDARMLASATGYSVERVEELMKLWWEETPIEDLTVRTLPVLKEALGPNEWERFRRYLLEVQAPKMSASRYSEVGEER